MYCGWLGSEVTICKTTGACSNAIRGSRGTFAVGIAMLCRNGSNNDLILGNISWE